MTPTFDPGLQPERTELAWRRTALALAVGSLIALRLLPVAFDNIMWVWAGVTGLSAAALVWLMARKRYLAITERLHQFGDRAELPDAKPLLFLAAFASGSGLIGLAVVVLLANGSY